MNIGIVTQWFDSGAGNVSKSYADLLGKDHDVFIYVRGGKILINDKRWDKKNVTWSPPNFDPTGVYLKHFKAWTKRNKIELVLFNEQRNWEVVIFAKKLGLLTGAYVDYYTQDTVPFFQLYDFLVCNTKRHFEVFKHHKQSLYCPWGTNVDIYKPIPKRPNRAITFICSAGWCGSYSKNQAWMDRRGIGLVLKAFFLTKGNCKLLVYSQDNIQDCPEDWRNIINTDDRISFIYGTFHPFPYNEGDIYVYPSRLDGIGLTLPEALSSGLPAITTDSPPMNEFVFDNENGQLIRVEKYLARPDGYYWPETVCEISHLSSIMNDYLNNKQLLEHQSKNARDFAINNLDWEKNGSILLKWISSLEKDTEHHLDLILKIRKYDQRISPTINRQILILTLSILLFSRSMIKFYFKKIKTNLLFNKQ